MFSYFRPYGKYNLLDDILLIFFQVYYAHKHKRVTGLY